MSSIKYRLQPGERVALATRVHPVVLLPAALAFVAALALLGLEMAAVRSPMGLGDSQAALLLSASGLCFFIAAVLGIPSFLMFSTTELLVTSQRVIGKKGWMPPQALGIALPQIPALSANTLDVLLPRIEDVRVRQGILGELLNLGTVTIAGAGRVRESYWALRAPVAMQMKINHMIDRITEAAA